MVVFSTGALPIITGRERQRPPASKFGESYGHTVTYTNSSKLGFLNTTAGLPQHQNQAHHF